MNVPLGIAGRTVVPDFRWPEQRLVLEADGRNWHSGTAARQADSKRRRLLEASGERVIRVTWHQAVAYPRATLDRLGSAGVPLASKLSDPGGSGPLIRLSARS